MKNDVTIGLYQKYTFSSQQMIVYVLHSRLTTSSLMNKNLNV